MEMTRRPQIALPLELAAAEQAEIEASARFSFDRKQFKKHVSEGVDIFTIIIRAQLYLEHILITLLREAFVHPEALDLRRWTFPAKLDLCIAMGLVPSELRSAIAKINEMRNHVAHKLDFQLTETIKQELWQSIPLFLQQTLLDDLKLTRGDEHKVEFDSIFTLIVYWVDIWRQQHTKARIAMKYSSLWLEQELSFHRGKR
jgi:hypothetical protein